MAFMGYTTNQDLTKFGRILIMGRYWHFNRNGNQLFPAQQPVGLYHQHYWCNGFYSLTAYDVQKLKRIREGLEYDVAELQPTILKRCLSLVR